MGSLSRFKQRQNRAAFSRNRAAGRIVAKRTAVDRSGDGEGKENDHGGAIVTPATPPRSKLSKGGGDGFPRPPLSSGHGCRIYVEYETASAMEAAVNDMPLPATLSNVCIALQNNETVLKCHEEAANLPQMDDEMAMKRLEIIGSSLGSMSLTSGEGGSVGVPLSPTQKLKERGEEFKAACSTLISGGNGNMMSTWEEVKGELSEIFSFGVVNIEPSQSVQQHGAAATAAITKSRGKNKGCTTKQTPVKALSPKRSFAKRGIDKVKKLMIHSTKRLTIDAYRRQMREKMGEDRYRQIFNHAHITISKPGTPLDDEAARLDEKIAQKESELRSAKRADEVLAAKEKADKEREALESATKLMRPFTDEEQRTVNAAVRGVGPESEVLARHDADSVQRGSMQTLEYGTWLNDEVINYFLKICLAKRDEALCAKQPGRKRSHFFNSFFVQTMFDEKNNNAALRGKYNYKNVKRWGKKVPGKDVFNLKYIVCPINLDNMHWTSAVIFMEEKKIQYFDSMGGTAMEKLEGLLQYLKDEHKAKRGEDMDDSEWKLVPCTKDTPRQRNGVDCGVFTCMICDFISKDCPLVFNQDHIDQCRDRIALSILKNCAIE